MAPVAARVEGWDVIARWVVRAVAGLALCLAVGCGPQMDGLTEGEPAAVARVTSGESLILDSGLRVLLAEVDAPNREEPFAQEARAGAEVLAMARPVRLAYGGATRLQPRGGAGEADGGAELALAHVFVRAESGRWLWLQGELVQRGLARVRPRRDNAARAAALLRLEAQARAQRQGLWAQAAYRVRDELDLLTEAETLPDSCAGAPFLILEGRVARVDLTERAAYFNFGGVGEEREDITLRVARADFPLWAAAGRTPDAYAGLRVRARGPTAARGGPLLCLEHPAGLEVLE